MKHRHQGSVVKELYDIIDLSINSLEDVYESFRQDFSVMKNIELDKRQIAELTGRIFLNEGIINSAQMGIVKQEFVKPTFQDFSDNSLYSYYNWLTYALKESHSTKLIQDHINLHSFITNEFNL